MKKQFFIVLLGIIILPAAFAGTDFNGDGKDDIVTFDRGTAGDVWVALSTGAVFAAGTRWHTGFCYHNEIPAYGDFNGDGKDDIISFIRDTQPEPGRGDVMVALSNGSGFGTRKKWSDWFCITTEIPAVGDFNGDGKDDIAVFLRSTQGNPGVGDVIVALSNGASFNAAQKWHDFFCINDEMPLVGDFNGDRKDDIATLLWDGKIYVAKSTGTSFGSSAVWHTSFDPKEIPMAADVNGDGRDDIVAFRRQCFDGRGTNMFNLALRGDVMVTLSTGSAFSGNSRWHDFFCIDNEIPMVGDVNGDRQADIITFIHEMRTDTARGDVYVAHSIHTCFSGGMKYNDWFAINDEIPTTEAALYPYCMFFWTYEDTTHEFVAYCSNEETRFKTNAGKFVDHFDSWPCAQYYWGRAEYLQENHMYYIDTADLAFLTGHGSPSHITIYSNQGVDLTQCAWGSYATKSRTADLEVVTFESCKVLAMDAGWQDRWLSNENRRRPFSWLHLACGFRNTHKESPVVELSKQFANNLDDDLSVRRAWLKAAEYEDDWVWGHCNEGCVFYIRPHKDETIHSVDSLGDRWYRHTDYILDAEYFH